MLRLKNSAGAASASRRQAISQSSDQSIKEFQMIRRFLQHRVTLLFAGLATGLVISSVVALLCLHVTGFFEAARMRWLETKLHAAAAQSGDVMAVATGAIDEGVEGLFVLDFISGDLTCGVMNPRTGTIGGLFKRNVVQDLGVEQGKQPKYLMTTGIYTSPARGSNTRPAQSIVYVADSTSGRYMGYSLPWNSQLLNANVPQIQPMVPIGGGSARNVLPE
jgi:hypothetical protein